MQVEPKTAVHGQPSERPLILGEEGELTEPHPSIVRLVEDGDLRGHAVPELVGHVQVVPLRLGKRIAPLVVDAELGGMGAGDVGHRGLDARLVPVRQVVA